MLKVQFRDGKEGLIASEGIRSVVRDPKAFGERMWEMKPERLYHGFWWQIFHWGEDHVYEGAPHHTIIGYKTLDILTISYESQTVVILYDPETFAALERF